MTLKYIPAALVAGILLFVNGCIKHKATLPSREASPDFYKNTYDMDPERKKLGLPLLDNKLVFASWTNQSETNEPFSHADFMASDKITIPRLDLKAIFWDTAGIVFERNYFTGPSNEKLQLIYGYRITGSWNCLGFDCNFMNDTTKFTKEEVDSILRRWGFTY
jgi:hypothetical protein